MISIETVQKEHLECRTKVFDYFNNQFPEEIKKLTQDISKEFQEEETLDPMERLGGEFALSFSDWLLKKNFSTFHVSPLNYYATSQCGKDYSIEDMINVKKMYLLSFVGFFKPKRKRSDGGYDVRNIVAGEDMIIYPTNVEFSNDLSVFSERLWMQKVEYWKGYWFCCGNGNLYQTDSYGKLITELVKFPTLFGSVFYISDKNKEKGYAHLEKLREKHENHFGIHPIIFKSKKEYISQMSEFYIKNNYPKGYERALSDEGANFNDTDEIIVWISKEGDFRFHGYTSLKESMKTFSKKTRSERTEFMYELTGFFESEFVPIEAKNEVIEEFKRDMDFFLPLLDKYYSINFPNIEAYIKFVNPLSDLSIPSMLLIDTHLKPYILEGKNKTERNDTCYCGSEKKFKKCCGN